MTRCGETTIILLLLLIIEYYHLQTPNPQRRGPEKNICAANIDVDELSAVVIDWCIYNSVRSVATQQRLAWCSWFWRNSGGIPVIFFRLRMVSTWLWGSVVPAAWGGGVGTGSIPFVDAQLTASHVTKGVCSPDDIVLIFCLSVH